MFRPGTSWVQGIGPEGAPAGIDKKVRGASRLTATDSQDLAASVSSRFQRFIAASLGIDHSRVHTVTMTGLSHYRVESLYDTKLANYIILETITADSIDFSVESNFDHGGGIDIADGLTDSIQSLDAVVSFSGGEKFRITSAEPLVIAIRVAQVSYAQRSFEIPLNGEPSDASIGYSISESSVPDPLGRSVEVAINNSDLVMFETINTELVGNQTFVNNVRRQAIGDSDPQAKAADYVWDVFVLRWGTPPRVRITRQYLTLRPARAQLFD